MLGFDFELGKELPGWPDSTLPGVFQTLADAFMGILAGGP